MRSQSRCLKAPWDSRFIAHLSQQEAEKCPQFSKGSSYFFPLNSVPQLDLAPAEFPRPPSTTVSLSLIHCPFLGSDPANWPFWGFPGAAHCLGFLCDLFLNSPQEGRPSGPPSPQLFVRGLRASPYERLVAQLSLSYN